MYRGSAYNGVRRGSACGSGPPSAAPQGLRTQEQHSGQHLLGGAVVQQRRIEGHGSRSGRTDAKIVIEDSGELTGVEAGVATAGELRA